MTVELGGILLHFPLVASCAHFQQSEQDYARALHQELLITLGLQRLVKPVTSYHTN